jgi:hypothetical protein
MAGSLTLAGNGRLASLARKGQLASLAGKGHSLTLDSRFWAKWV